MEIESSAQYLMIVNKKKKFSVGGTGSFSQCEKQTN